MITDDILTPIGHTVKPHGIGGEINAVVDEWVDLDSLSCLVMKVDGINVPFYIDTWRSRGSEAVLIKFDHVSDEAEAEAYCGMELMALSAELPDDDNGCDEADGFYASDFIGWTILDNGRELGTAEDFDDSTENLRLSVKTSGGKHIFVPLADELVLEANPAARRLDMDLPAGLFEL